MAGYVPHYRDKFNNVIKICLKCEYVDELPLSTMNCPGCGMPNHMGFFETAEKLKRYIEMYKPKGIRSPSEHLQYIIDEVLKEDDCDDMSDVV